MGCGMSGPPVVDIINPLNPPTARSMTSSELGLVTTCVKAHASPTQPKYRVYVRLDGSDGGSGAHETAILSFFQWIAHVDDKILRVPELNSVLQEYSLVKSSLELAFDTAFRGYEFAKIGRSAAAFVLETSRDIEPNSNTMYDLLASLEQLEDVAFVHMSNYRTLQDRDDFIKVLNMKRDLVVTSLPKTDDYFGNDIEPYIVECTTYSQVHTMVSLLQVNPRIHTYILDIQDDRATPQRITMAHFGA